MEKSVQCPLYGNLSGQGERPLLAGQRPSVPSRRQRAETDPSETFASGRFRAAASVRWRPILAACRLLGADIWRTERDGYF